MIDKWAVNELQLFISSDYQLYHGQQLSIEKNLTKRWEKGTYKPNLAVKLWLYLADAGARKYKIEIPNSDVKFTKPIRTAAAAEMEEDFRKELEQK